MPAMVDDSSHTSQAADAGRRYLLLGTAGHIDHGKTSLIKALTGVDTDRLPEEKLRGMTIELGFAHLEVGEGADAVCFGIVDVPGHEKFVRTMVAGATAIDVVLLVVAADDSVMPQTREHLDIVKLLGVRCGVVAVTKCDVVDAELAELVCEEVRDLLAGSPLEDAEMVKVSSTTGSGLDELKEALHRESHDVAERETSEVFRLAIDRVFSKHGRGTVVTGSATSGTVSIGDTLELLPSRKLCKVRGLQTHFDQADRLRLGQRVAVNLTGVEKGDVSRGDELASCGYFTPSRMIDVQLVALSSNAKPIKHLQQVRFCTGTKECFARVRLLGGVEQSPTPEGVGSPRVGSRRAGLRGLAAGAQGFAQLESDEPLAAAWGQQFIIRDETDSRTLGGGMVLRPVSRRLNRTDQADDAGLTKLLDGDEADRLEEVIRFQRSKQRATVGGQPDEMQLACAGGIAPQRISAVLQKLEQQNRLIALGDQRELVPAVMIEECCRLAVERLQHFHTKHVDEPGYPLDSFVGWLQQRWGESLGAHVFGQLKSGSRPTLQLLGRYCCLAEFAPKISSEEERLLKQMVAEFEAASFQPPAVAALKCAASASKSRVGKLIKIATATGELVQISPGIVVHAGRLDELKERMAREIRTRGGLTVADIRTLIDSSRKYVVPLVEYLDKTGFTRRVGDQRVLVDGD